MNSLLVTLLLVSVGIILLTVGFVYGMDFPENVGKKWTDIVKEELGVRIVFWIAGGLALGYAGLFQFWH